MKTRWTTATPAALLSRRHINEGHTPNLLGTIAAGLAPGPHLPAFAEGDWPSRIVAAGVALRGGRGERHLVAYPGRAVGRSLNQPVHRREQPRRGHRVANDWVSRAAADGYTFLYAAAPLRTAEALFRETETTNRKDLQPVAMAMMAPLFLVVNAQAPSGPFRK